MANIGLDGNDQSQIIGVSVVSTPTLKLTGTGTLSNPIKGEVLGGVGGASDWNSISNTPITVAGYGITDAVTTSGSYNNPSWITGLDWGKISNSPTTISGYGITDGVTLNAAQSLQNKTLINPILSVTGQTIGDLYYYNGTSWSRLPIGSNGQALKVVGGNLQWDTDIIGPGGGGGTIVSVFGRTDPNIVAQSGDYTFSQIGGKPTTISGYGITDGVTLTGAQTLTNKTLTSPTINSGILATPVINVGSDASGDMYYRNSSGNITRIPAGGLGELLSMGSSNIPTWGPAPNANSTTIAALRANMSPSTSIPYYISDVGHEGYFYYSAADSATPENGNGGSGTVIAAGDGKRFRRSYTGPIHTSWFGLKLNDNSGTQQTKNVAAIAAAFAVSQNRQWVVTLGGGTLYLNGTSTFDTEFNKRPQIWFECDIQMTVAGDCFVLEGGPGGLKFKHTGRLLGPNTVGNNSSEASWLQADGRGIYMKNLYNAIVQLGEVQLFRTGIEMAGEANGDESAANGSQYNQVWFERSYNNHTQIKITTYGVAGTFGNWCNESFWYNGQVGNGIPGQTYGGGGWYGLVVDKDAGASGVSNPQPYYGINGHIFNCVGFEGNDTYIKAGYTGNCLFVGCSFEPEGAHVHFDLDPVNCQLWRFEGSTSMRDSKFAAGRKGYKTHIENSGFYGAISGGTSSQFIGTSATSIPASPAMTGFNYSANGNFIVSQDTYAGPSALNNSDDQTHVLYNRMAQFPTVQNGIIKMGSFRRHGAYKRSYIDSTSNTTPVDLAPVIGYVRVQSSVTINPKVYKIQADDLYNTSASTVANFEHFYVEKNNDTPIEFVKSDDNSPLIASSNFPSQGLYFCVWRSNAYKVYKIDGSASAGTGDVVGPSSSVNTQIALFDGTTGKLLKAATSTGYVKVVSGVMQSSSATIPKEDISSSGAAAGQSIRRTLDNSSWEWYTPGTGGGGGIDTVGTPVASSSTINKGATISGSTIALAYADATRPGIISTTNQTIPGNKTFGGWIQVVQGTSGGDGQLRFNPNSQLRAEVDIPAQIEYDAITGEWWGTDDNLSRELFIRSDTVATVTQLTWLANPIGEGYGGNGADTVATASTISYTVADGVGVVLGGYAGAGNQTVTLPNASLYPNRRITVLARIAGKSVNISNGDSHSNAINQTGIAPSGITYRALGSVWFIINKF